jgi:putative membrane protein
MVGLALRTLISAGGLWLAARLVGGIAIEGTGTLLLAALLLGLVNAVVRPVLVVLTLPITVITLGLFLWVINAGMLLLVSRLLRDFTIASFGNALLGALIVSVTAWVASWYIGPRGRVEVMVVRR